MYHEFRENLSKNINNSEFKSESEECFLIEESLNNELIKYFENDDNIQDKNNFENIQNHIINDFPSTLNCLYKNKIIKLISKKLIKSISNKDNLKDLIGIKYYCGNNKLIIEYKDKKALLLIEPLNNSELNKNTYIIYPEDKEEKDKNSFFEQLISEKLDMNQYKSEIKDNIVSFERYLNINKSLFELFISILNYENDLKENMKNVFKENEDYFLINSEWINICKYCCSKISDYYLNNIKNNKIEIKDNNFEYIFNDMNEKKILFNLEHKKLFEDIMKKEKIIPQTKEIQNTKYNKNSYIVNSQIKEIISKLLSNEIKKINIFVNDYVNIVTEKKIFIGNLNDKFIFMPKYILFYQQQKIFLKEQKNLLKSSFEKYIESFNCDLQKGEEQILKEKNKKIGKLIVLPDPKTDNKEIIVQTNNNQESIDIHKKIIEQENKNEEQKGKEDFVQTNQNEDIKDVNKMNEKINEALSCNNINIMNKAIDNNNNSNNNDKILDLTKQLEQNKKELSELKQDIINKESVIENQKQIIMNKEKDLEIQKEDMKNKVKEIENQKEIINYKDNEISKLKEDMKIKVKEIEGQKEDIKNKDNVIESQKENMKNKDNEISKMIEDMKTKDNVIKSLKEEISKIKKMNDELKLEKEIEINNIKNIKNNNKEINEQVYKFEDNKEVIAQKNKKSRNKYNSNDMIPGRDINLSENSNENTNYKTKDNISVNSNNHKYKTYDNNISTKFNFNLNQKIKENISELKEDLKNKEIIIENQNKDIKSKINEISKLKDDMKTKDNVIESQKEQILKIKKENDELNFEKDKEMNNLKNISKNKVDELNKNIENLMKKNKDIENYFTNIIISNKQEFFDELKRIYLNLCNQNSNKEAQEKILNDKLKNSKNIFLELRKEIDNKVKEFIKKNEEANNKIIENQKDISSIIEKEKEVNKKISFLEDKENLLDKENKEFEIKKKQFEKEIEKHKVQIQKNNELSKKNEELEKEIKKKTEKLNEIEKKMKKPEIISLLPEKPILIGLNNIGATCFMNSTLQCLSQTKELTKFFLNANNENRIINNNIASTNRNALQLSPIYLELIKKLWDKNGEKSFSPHNFMNIVEKMNPLFKQGQAGDSKDFIIFILEQLHKELKRPINANNIGNNNIVLNQYDKTNSFNFFFNDFQKECSIISDIFFGFTETTNECLYCKNYYNSNRCNNPICYNYGIFNCLIFPLEEVKNMKNKSIQINNIQINNNCVTLYECFCYNQKSDLFTGDNRNYCNICKQLWDSIYTSKIFVCPNNLIIILNRGKGNIYDVKLDFSETIDITQFVLKKDKPQIIYNLYGVITHIGQSGPNAHFVASCKNPIDYKWYRFNDAFVNPINNLQKDVIEFGTPYILFYSKI